MIKEAKQKVLLVEDDPWLAELEAEILVGAGYDVELAPHASSAIAKIDTYRPDAIVLDVLLTGSTAFALLHELQSYSDTETVPIVLCTNMAEQFSVEKLSSYGVKKVMNKSTMHPSDLVAAVKGVLL